MKALELAMIAASMWCVWCVDYTQENLQRVEDLAKSYSRVLKRSLGESKSGFTLKLLLQNIILKNKNNMKNV